MVEPTFAVLARWTIDFLVPNSFKASSLQPLVSPRLIPMHLSQQFFPTTVPLHPLLLLLLLLLTGYRCAPIRPRPQIYDSQPAPSAGYLALILLLSPFALICLFNGCSKQDWRDLLRSPRWRSCCWLPTRAVWQAMSPRCMSATPFPLHLPRQGP
jgi:hypothetical protein